MKKLSLTSILTIMATMPALAAVGDTAFMTNQNVNNGCVSDILGVSSGTAATVAEFVVNKYICGAGTYLPAGTDWTSVGQYTDNNCAQCAANSYCVGSSTSSDATDGKYEFNDTVAKGTQTCPSGFPSSDAGSDAQSDCYRTCTTNDVAHSANVTGRFYSGETSASNSCEPTSTNGCVAGYHYTAGNPDLMTAIGVTQAGTEYGYIRNSGGNLNASTYGLTENGTFAVNYGTGKGIIKGKSQCSTRSATKPWVGSDGAYVLQSDGATTTLPDSTGQYCYCQLTEYTPDGGNAQSLSAPWVFLSNRGTAVYCETACASGCADNLQSDSSLYLAYRSAVFGLIQSSPAQCSANEITINWGGYGANNTESESTSCTYDDALTTPTTAPVKTGYTFTGWKFTAQ